MTPSKVVKELEQREQKKTALRTTEVSSSSASTSPASEQIVPSSPLPTPLAFILLVLAGALIAHFFLGDFKAFYNSLLQKYDGKHKSYSSSEL